MTTSPEFHQRFAERIAATPVSEPQTLPPEAFRRFLDGYFRHAPADDLAERSADDLAGLAAAHLAQGAQRLPGGTSITVTPPAAADHGGSTVVRIVTDDKAFLVDTVSMELNRGNWSIRTLFHPQLVVRRDASGRLTDVLDDGAAGLPESWICVEAFPPLGRSAEELAPALASALTEALGWVERAVADREAMRQRLHQTIDWLNDNPQPVSPAEVRHATELLEWMSRQHFVFLGYREFGYRDGGYRTVPGTGLGILTGDAGDETAFHAVPLSDEPELLVILKDSRRSPVHRPAYLDYVGVRLYDRRGELTGERRFLGLWSAAAYSEDVARVPGIAAKAAALLDSSGYDRHSHGGSAVWQAISTYPRDELFQAGAAELQDTIGQIAEFRGRRQVRLFVRPGRYGRFLSCLVYLPRERFNTEVRLRIQHILMEALGGESLEYQTSVTESVLARLYYVIKRPDGDPFTGTVDVPALQARIALATRSWDDEFDEAARGFDAHERGVEFSDAYEEEFSPAAAVRDLELANRAVERGERAYDLYEPTWSGDEADVRFKVFTQAPMSLTDVMPHLSVLGVDVVDERPYEWDLRGKPMYLYDFGLRLAGGRESLAGWGDEARHRFIEAFDATYSGKAESGKFNKLVMTGGLTWRQITWLRGMSRYLVQAGVPYSQPYIATALNENPPIAAALVRAFEAKFDPGVQASDQSAREQAVAEVYADIERQLADVASLDQDRILRHFMAVLKAMIRTNAFAPDAPALAFKLRPRELSLLPEPRPLFEIFVYSPRVQGVHLRFGTVARGGLRWSDRREDFRTEVLGLVKAQMVKNTVIVPTGAKGGFVPQHLPDPALDRAAWLAEGVACYQIFVSSLLSVTDNIVDGVVVPPEGVVRHDSDDPYLVVAADKGTATFSDIANQISIERGHWLGDAFASGGSAGYDHKGMGITARGAWESVKRHFTELGRDCQNEDFTCVGIGDMAGDVFGNGMLLSRHLKLVGAFNHAHVFLDPDPDPDPEASFAERERLFRLPRSSWADYDAKLISTGGGVYPRTAKSIPISPEVRAVLGIADGVTKLTPAELIHAMLQAPVDLLWNGGIGTYVKSSAETHADAGDKANDAVRVDGSELRALCVGEGGNLGMTQLGRVEYAQRGGRLNTDFIDNSAGVDTSDHEVNIKILLADQAAAGTLTQEDRNELLAQMTDEVAALVLAHNIDQNLALSNSVFRAVELAGSHEGWMRSLEQAGYLDRELEALPSTADMSARIAGGRGLTRPELATLLAYTKIFLKDRVLASELPDDPYLADRLIGYFPRALRERYAADMPKHRLAREIIATVAVNRFVNSQGISAFHRLSGETGASPMEVIRAQLAARSIFAVGRTEVALGRMHGLDAQVVTELRVRLRRMVERATRWLLANRKAPLDVVATTAQFTAGVADLRAHLGSLVTTRQGARAAATVAQWTDKGVPAELAREIAEGNYAHYSLTIVEIAQKQGVEPRRAAEVYFRLAEALGLDLLLESIVNLPQLDRWDTMARAALRDDLLAVHGELAAAVLASGSSDPETLVADWLAAAPGTAERTAIIRQLCEEPDVARMSVGVRQVRALLP